MKVHDFPTNTNLLEIQQYANGKGWKIVKATWVKGIRPKRLTKEEEFAILRKEIVPKKLSIDPYWRLYYYN